MYTDEDLDNAVKKGIFSALSLEEFRSYISEQHSTHGADEENFRLIASFNDIFVVIACLLLLVSSAWISQKFSPVFAAILLSILSWGLAEFFVLKRKMALPAIVLLISFTGSSFMSVVLMFDKPTEVAFMLAALVVSLGTWFHWKRFRVPITVAAGAAMLVTFVISMLISLIPGLNENVMYLIFFGGIAIFSTAMVWDVTDLKRITNKSDVAFWLHLISAPLIVHPVFSTLGVLEGNESLTSLGTIITLYLLLTLISIVIDRRAFMVSSLLYVLIALTRLLDTYGLAGDGFAYVGVLIGFSLLLLSGFWHKVRRLLVSRLPESIKVRVPISV